MELSAQSVAPEKLVPTSLNQLKNYTKALKRELSRCEIDIPHASLLHVVAKSFDYENYHAAEAILGKSAKPPRRSPKKKTSSDTEEFDLLMIAIREEIGEIKFNYAMRIHPHYSDAMYNPLATLDKLGYYSFKQQAKLAVQIFADLNVEYLDISSASGRDGNGLIEYFEVLSNNPNNTKKTDEFYVETIPGGKKVYYIPESAPEDDLVIMDYNVDNYEEVVFCAWPSRNESRKQYIIPFDGYFNFISGNYIPDGAHWTKRYRYDGNEKRIYDGQSPYLNEQLEQFQSLKMKIQNNMPTEEEVEAAKSNAFIKVKRDFMLSGLTGSESSAAAKWCVYTLGYDFAPITRATSWFLSDAEGAAWDKNIHKENVVEIILIIIYAEAVYEAIKGTKKEMGELANDWRRFALTAGGRKEITRLLSGKENFLHLMNEHIALILNMNYDDALQLVNDSCVYRLDEIEYKSLLAKAI